MLKASFMGIFAVDLPEAVGNSIELEPPHLKGRLVVTRQGARTVGFHFDNTMTSDPNKKIPFQADFEVAAEFKANPITGLATFTKVGAPIFKKLMRFPTPAEDPWVLQVEPEFRIFGDRDINYFLPIVDSYTITDGIERYFSSSEVLPGRFKWTPDGSNMDGEFFGLSFPSLLEPRQTLWEWVRFSTGGSAKTLLGGMRVPTFGTKQQDAQLLDFAVDGGDPGRSVQGHQIRRFGCNPASQVGDEFPALAVCLKPTAQDRILHIDPAIGDRRFPAAMSNALTFGISLANGELVLGRHRDSFDTLITRVDLSWESAPDNESGPLLLINTVKDEHGLPVAFESNHKRIRLRARPDYYCKDYSSHQDNLTIGGIDIYTEAPADEGVQPLVDLEKVNRREIRKPLEGRLSALQVKTSVESDSAGSETLWECDGEQLQIRKVLPKLMNGGSHNAFFALAEKEREREVNLDLENVIYLNPDGTQPTAPPLVLKRLGFVGDEKWSLHQVYEEEAYGAGGLPALNTGAKAVGIRRSATAPANIVIPAMDIRYAAANMPAANTRVPENSNTTTAAIEWYKETDDSLIQKYSDGLEAAGMQKHLVGFRLEEQTKVGYATILGRMRVNVPEMKYARNMTVLAEANENTFKFGAHDSFQPKALIKTSATFQPEAESLIDRPVYPPASKAEEVEPLHRAIKHRVWLLTYILDSVEREAEDFGKDDFGSAEWYRWQPARDAVKQLKNLDTQNPFNLLKIRADLLDQLEGLTAPARHIRQLVVVLAKMMQAKGIALLDELSKEIKADSNRLRKLADFESFKTELQAAEANSAFRGVMKIVQGVVRGWRPAFAPSFYEVSSDISDPLHIPPVYHRLTLAIIRLVHQEIHTDGALRLAFKNLPDALEKDGEATFAVFERVWLHSVLNDTSDERAKQFMERLAKDTLDEAAELLNKFKRAVLQTVEPTQEFVLRLMERLDGLRVPVTNEDPTQAEIKSRIIVVWEYFIGAADALDGIRRANFDAIVQQGRNELLKNLQEQWEEASQPSIKEIQAYIKDQVFSDEVYERIVSLEKDIERTGKTAEEALKEARRLRDQLAELIDLGKAAGDLIKSLKTEPPAYLVVGKSFHIELSKDQQALMRKLLAMWGQSLTLCNLGGGQAWDFQLFDHSTLILKLSGSMTMNEILINIENQYRDDVGEVDPLGLWSEDLLLLDKTLDPPYSVQPEKVNSWTRNLVQTWVTHFVDPDLQVPSWRGIFIIKPTADLSRNQITRDLCGLRYLDARYVALGGGSVEFEKDHATLDVYTTIFKLATKQKRTEIPPEKVANRDTDAGVALTKFDARIKNTRLRANSMIELTLDINRLFGRDHSQLDDNDRKGYDSILISGKTKSPDEAKGKNEAATLEFSAVFPKERELKVDVMFIKAVRLRGIKAAIQNGRTTLDIDGNIDLKSWNFEGPEAPKLDFGFLGDEKITLSGFRLNFPRVDKIADAAMGALRDLIFDFESISLNFETPRSLTLGFLELTAKSVGYIRNLKGEGRSRIPEFWGRFMPFCGSDIPNTKFDLPYLLFDIDFGQLPKFGLGSVDRLKLSLVVGAQLDEGNRIHPYIGISGLDATEIKFDLFRLLTLSMARLYISADVASKLDPYESRGEKYTVIGVEDLRLQLFGIDLIGKASGEGTDGARGLDFLMLQNDKSGRGVLGIINLKKGANLKPPFITLNWVLLARNMEVDSKILDHLLLFEDASHVLVSEIVSREDTQTQRLPDPNNPGSRRDVKVPGKVNYVKAGLTGKNDWLFGISFGLAGLITNCRLVLQDEVYYGITLQAEWLQPIFGGDHISLAYIPGDTPAQDRFLLDVPLAFLNLFANVQAGWGTFSWALNTDTMISLGFPFRIGNRYQWDRAFAIYLSPIMGQFGFYIEKRTRLLKTTTDHQGKEVITLGGGMGVTLGYGFALGNSRLWVRGGIGVFVIIEGEITSRIDMGGDIKLAVVGMRIRGVIGIIAFVEGGIDIWIVSARFRVELQAALTVEIHFLRGVEPLALTYDATLYAGYYAKASIHIGFATIDFEVSGSYAIGVSGQYLLE